MFVIFFFSSQVADDSDDMSLSVGMVIGKWTVPNFEELDPVEQFEFAERINYPVRKCAHATEYGVLALLFYGTYWSYGVKKKTYLSVLSTMLYAMTDEFHQIFVPGRSGNLKDVCIDSAGGMIAIIILEIILCLYQSRKKIRGKVDNHSKII